MIRTLFLIGSVFLLGTDLSAQFSSRLPADAWVDSVFKKLTPEEKIAQLMVVRGSAIDPKNKKTHSLYKGNRGGRPQI